MKQKHVDASREARLWLGQVIIPVITAVAIVKSSPQLSDSIMELKSKATNTIRNLFK